MVESGVLLVLYVLLVALVLLLVREYRRGPRYRERHVVVVAPRRDALGRRR